jgi:hypothetical protein
MDPRSVTAIFRVSPAPWPATIPHALDIGMRDVVNVADR